MKKTFAIFIFFMLSLSAYCDGMINLYTFGDFGYYTEKVSAIHKEDQNWFDASIAAGMQVLPKDKISVYAEAELKTDMYKSEQLRFKPVQQDYYVRLGAWIGPINFKIEHLCSHSVDTFNPLINGGHDKVSIGFDSRKLK